MGANDRLQLWNNVLTANGLKMNATETERMSTRDTSGQLKLNGEVTRNVDHVKYIDNKCRWFIQYRCGPSCTCIIMYELVDIDLGQVRQEYVFQTAVEDTRSDSHTSPIQHMGGRHTEKVCHDRDDDDSCDPGCLKAGANGEETYFASPTHE